VGPRAAGREPLTGEPIAWEDGRGSRDGEGGMVQVSATESPSRRTWLRTLTCALLAAAPALLPAEAAARSVGPSDAPARGAAAKPVVLAVWALADDDTPVSGGRVRVYASRRGAAARRPLRQRNGRRQERTHRAGMALLEFSRLPAEFTVEVAGGRAGGPKLRGAFRAERRGYRPGQVVHVNPVTTLIADHVAAHRRRGLAIRSGRARREIYRLLRIPRWQEQADLRNSDRYFDGDAYLRAVRRAGGVAALNRALVRQELRPGDRPRRFRIPYAPKAAPAAVDWLALLTGDPKVLVKEALKAIAILAAKKVGTLAAEKAGNAALGWVLAAFGYGDVLKDQDMQEIKQALAALGKQLTQLQDQVQLAGFSTLVHQTDRTIGQIDHASSQLALLANMPQSDPTRRAFTQTLVDYIGANLTDAPSILNQNLSANIPLSDNLIKSASRLVAQRGRFFDSKSSASVKSVYDYFATYQVKLALLLTEYYHAKPDTFSPAIVAANLAAVEANVDAQAASLKPSVPDRAVVDRRTGMMWTQAWLYGPQNVSLSEIAEIFKPQRGPQRFRLRPDAGPRNVGGLPHADWRVPTIGDFARLIEGWSGGNPSEWLQKDARMSKAMLEVAGSQMWARDGFDFRRGTVSELRIEVFDVQRGRSWQRPSIFWFFEDGWRGDFSNARAGLMLARALAAGETYWWGD
jgi:hypothetical protein